MSEEYQYPFDPSGVYASNLVEGETHTITAANGPDFNLIIPNAAPYFPESLVVVHVESGNTLQPGIDYLHTHLFQALTNSYPNKTVYGSFILVDTDMVGTLSIAYQTVGGEFVLTEEQITTILSNQILDPRTVTWDTIINKPFVYDPIVHRHVAEEFVGYGELVAAVRELADGLTLEYGRVQTLLTQHTSQSNPHKFITLLADAPLALHEKYNLACDVDFTLPAVTGLTGRSPIIFKKPSNFFPKVNVNGSSLEQILLDGVELDSLSFDSTDEVTITYNPDTNFWEATL